MPGRCFSVLVTGALLAHGGPGLEEPGTPASPRAVHSSLTAFTAESGGQAFGLVRWKGHVFVYRLHRGVPVLQDPGALALAGTVVGQALGVSHRLSGSALKAYLVEQAFPVPAGQRLFAGILGPRHGHGARVELVEADGEEAMGSGARYPVAGFQGQPPHGRVLILGDLEEGPVTLDQRNEPLLHVSEWVGF